MADLHIHVSMNLTSSLRPRAQANWYMHPTDNNPIEKVDEESKGRPHCTPTLLNE